MTTTYAEGRAEKTYSDLTYAEKYLLGSLAQFGPRREFDTISERVLVNTGFAERFHDENGLGMVRLTEKARATLSEPLP